MKRKILLCNNINSMREIKLNLFDNGSGGAIICNNSYLEVYFYSNFTHNIAGLHGGAMMLNTCSLNIQGNASFVGNNAINYFGFTSFGGAMMLNTCSLNIQGNASFVGNNAINYFGFASFAGPQGGAMMLNTCTLNIQGKASFVGNNADDLGGAMLLQNTNSSINGSLFLSNNRAQVGGALAIGEGNFTIKDYALFDSNYASFGGGALYISSHANFKFCGCVYSGSSNASFDAGSLPLKKVKAFDAECSTDNVLSFNNSIT